MRIASVFGATPKRPIPITLPSWFFQTHAAVSGAKRYVMNGTIRSATMFATLIIGLIAGPAVSL
jgi:hypothetical protein